MQHDGVTVSLRRAFSCSSATKKSPKKKSCTKFTIPFHFFSLPLTALYALPKFGSCNSTCRGQQHPAAQRANSSWWMLLLLGWKWEPWAVETFQTQCGWRSQHSQLKTHEAGIRNYGGISGKVCCQNQILGWLFDKFQTKWLIAAHDWVLSFIVSVCFLGGSSFGISCGPYTSLDHCPALNEVCTWVYSVHCIQHLTKAHSCGLAAKLHVPPWRSQSCKDGALWLLGMGEQILVNPVRLWRNCCNKTPRANCRLCSGSLINFCYICPAL